MSRYRRVWLAQLYDSNISRILIIVLHSNSLSRRPPLTVDKEFSESIIYFSLCIVCQKSPWSTKMHLLPSISEILSQTWYHCVQNAKRHYMSLISLCQHGFCHRLFIWACYLFLGWPAMHCSARISRINNMLRQATKTEWHQVHITCFSTLRWSYKS